MSRTPTPRRRRLAAIALAAGLALTGLSAQPSFAARAIDDACPAGAVPEDGFTDTGADGSAVETAIDCIVAYDIARGTTATTFNPTSSTTRAQMATFVMASLDVVDDYTRPTTSPDAFDDDDGDRHEANIDDAAAEGIVAGFPDGSYGPGRLVTRGQMATFLVRALEAAGADLPTTAPDAFDDDDGTSHEDNIDLIASLDIADGTSARTYGHASPVLRQQMAQFLARSLDLLVEEGLVTSLEEATPAAPASTNAAPGRVVALDKAANELELDTGQTTAGDYDGATADLRYRYDSNDTFRIGGTATDLAGFEAALSRGDAVDPGAYDPQASGTSVFDITDDGPKAPTTVTAEKGTGASTDDITVTIDPSTPGTLTMYQSFVVERAPVPNGMDESQLGIPGTFAEVGRVTVPTGATGATIAFVDRDVPPGAYRYRAAGIIDGDVGPTTADPNNETSVAPAAGQSGPASTNAVQTVRSGLSGTADDGDVWRFAFDAPITLTSTATLSLVEGADATQSGNEEATDVTRGGDATMTLNSAAVEVAGVSYGAGQVLTVELTRDLTRTAAVTGGNSSITYPLTVSATAGVAGTAGPWDLASSFDRRVENDVDAPVSTGAEVTDDGNNRISNGDTIEIAFDQDLLDDAEEPFADSITVSDGAQSVTLTHGTNATFSYTAEVDDPTSTSNVLVISAITTGTTAVDYGATTVVASARNITDPAGNGWAPGGKTVLGDTLAPSMTSATASTTPATPLVITLTYSEAITCKTFSAFQWTYDPDVTVPGLTPQPTSAECPSGATTGTSTTILLTFDESTPITPRSDDAITYTEAPPTAPAGRVVDTTGNEAVSPQTRAVN